jgi:hypothetical protein
LDLVVGAGLNVELRPVICWLSGRVIAFAFHCALVGDLLDFGRRDLQKLNQLPQ